VNADARRALDLVGLDVEPGRPVRQLGIGQQQMVEIAKALIKNARILVLDEPTAALTEADAVRLLRFLAELRTRGIASIYISHRLEEVFRIADRITVLRDGRTVGTAPASGLTPERVISLMVGREVKTLYPRPERATGEVVLSVSGWSVEDPLNPGRHVLKDVSFDLREGEVLGIAGLMGAGRTALVSSLFGAGRSRVTGTLRIRGRAKTEPLRSPKEAIAAGMALVSEDRKRYGLVLEATVGENITLATLRRFARHLLLDNRERDKAAVAQSGALRIKTASMRTIVNHLSGGNQQKVVLGKWLLTRPRILFLDEPTRGIDVGAKAEIYQLVKELAASGLAVIMVSSELPEVLGMSHRVLVLNQGRQTALLEGEAATPETVMAAATVMA
jgi:D-xylose transport system ATP-binding protein